MAECECEPLAISCHLSLVPWTLNSLTIKLHILCTTQCNVTHVPSRHTHIHTHVTHTNFIFFAFTFCSAVRRPSKRSDIYLSPAHVFKLQVQHNCVPSFAFLSVEWRRKVEFLQNFPAEQTFAYRARSCNLVFIYLLFFACNTQHAVLTRSNCIQVAPFTHIHEPEMQSTMQYVYRWEYKRSDYLYLLLLRCRYVTTYNVFNMELA